MVSASIALNRFGIGARPGESPPGDPKDWLLGQSDRFETRPTAIAGVANSHAAAAAFTDAAEPARRLRDGLHRKHQAGGADPAAVVVREAFDAGRREARRAYAAAVGRGWRRRPDEGRQLVTDFREFQAWLNSDR